MPLLKNWAHINEPWAFPDFKKIIKKRMIDCTWHIFLPMVAFHCNYTNIIFPEATATWKKHLKTNCILGFQACVYMCVHVRACVCVCERYNSSEKKLIFDIQSLVFLLLVTAQVLPGTFSSYTWVLIIVVCQRFLSPLTDTCPLHQELLFSQEGRKPISDSQPV